MTQSQADHTRPMRPEFLRDLMDAETREDDEGGAPPGHILRAMLAAKEREAEYAMGYSDIFVQMLERRSAGRNASHLLPHLRAGMELLDLGCGPGSITAGLADAVRPGTVTGLDLNESQLDIARERARRLGLENMELTSGDALRMPFPDGRFDAVHCHGFLMHSSSLRDQLEEIRRVLRPGGILSSRDMDVAGSFISPVHHTNEGMWQMLADIVRREGADPLMGRHLKTHLLNAGFRMLETGYAPDLYESAEEVAFLADFLTNWALGRDFQQQAGIPAGRFQEWREQVERWRRKPGALGCFQFGHALAEKPR